MTEESIPSKETCNVAHTMNNSIGFVAAEAEKHFGTASGKTALFWALVETIRQHLPREETPQ
jgi:hypothetical protein